MNPDKQRTKIKEALQAAHNATTRKIAQKAIKKYEKAMRKLSGIKKQEEQM